jgi:SAM-dependent methyltransferase
MSRNIDEATVESFGDEWSRFDQSTLADEELRRMFSEYFAIFPWDQIPDDARGADIGCGTGRWARLVARRVAELHCVDASADALAVARRSLTGSGNVVFHHASIDALPFENESLDFAYCLGVLHHLPDTRAGLDACVRALKPGAPFLLYLYYAFDNRPFWYRWLWRLSDGARRGIARLAPGPKALLCDAIALLVYWPLASIARLLETLGLQAGALPLSMYRRRSFYSMRTDARDRFGTPVEKRFSRTEIVEMMTGAGLVDVRLCNSPPYWCVIGFKASRGHNDVSAL